MLNGQRVSGKWWDTCLAELQPFSAFCSELKRSSICFFCFFVALSSSRNGADLVSSTWGHDVPGISDSATEVQSRKLSHCLSAKHQQFRQWVFFCLSSFGCSFQHKSHLCCAQYFQKCYNIAKKYINVRNSNCPHLLLFEKTRFDEVTIPTGFS